MTVKFTGWLAAALFLLAVPAISDTSPTYIAGDSWHSGGTLHSASLYEWHQASHANQLATSSDWVVAFMRQENAMPISNNGLRERSEAVVSCVNRKTGTLRAIWRNPVVPNAVLCMIQMEFPRK